MKRLLTFFLSVLIMLPMSTQARFLGQDQAAGSEHNPPSLHKYLYAYQNPTIYVDPDGNAPVIKESADALGQWADETRKTADAMENNGINVFPAAAMGLGAGLLDVLSFGTQIINQGVNLGVDALASPNSNSLFVSESRADLQETRGEVTGAIESTVSVAKVASEDISGTANKLKDITVVGVQSFARGETGAVSNAFSALAVAPSGVASVKATAQGIKATGKGIKQVVNKSREFIEAKKDSIFKVKQDISVPNSTAGNAAHSVNAQAALKAKLSALEKAQQTAATTRQLPDGRIRYYGAETPARNPGATRGASYVTEWNPKTGDVRSWMESYDQAGNVNRVHPKMINGQSVDAQHYPPTARELGAQ